MKRHLGFAHFLKTTLSYYNVWRAITLGVFAFSTTALVAQETPKPQKRVSLLEHAVGLSELPSSPWGAIAQGHLAPCFLLDRTQSSRFTFPLIIGQRRVEQVVRKQGLERTWQVYERRSIGLSPLNTDNDDSPVTEADRLRNRRTTPVSASAKGVYWEAKIPFLPANPPEGKRGSEPFWGEGEATVITIPANAEPSAEGLILVITLTNRSLARQTWFVELLGGIAATPNGLAPDQLKIEKDANTGLPVLRHEKSPVVFALAGRATASVLAGYVVKSAFLSDPALHSQRDSDGQIKPAVIRTEDAPKTNLSDWGLLRSEGILLAPGEKRTITLCIGAGRDSDEAKDSATTLLGLVDDVLPNGKAIEGGGLLSQAQKALEREVALRGGSPVFEGLVAQSLTNVVQTDLRRVGVSSRDTGLGTEEGAYHPAIGGLIALGWSVVRPEWAASQINAHLLTQLDANRPLTNPIAVAPTNLFALWELYQATRDRGLLERAYPSAKHRYQELLSAGRSTTNEGLFSWSSASQQNQALMTRPLAIGGISKSFAPEYSAYVIRSAKTLLKIAEALSLPEEERKIYQTEIEVVTRTLNTQLWDAQRGTFTPKSNGQPLTLEEPDSIATLIPLVVGADSITTERRSALLKALTNPELFWSSYGLRSLSKSSFAYRPAVAGKGGVHYGVNWLIWKALLDIGEAETANRLAQNLLNGYAQAHNLSGGYPEWLNGDTGAPQGANDYSGDACVLWLLQRSYHSVGTISAGWDTTLISPYYDKAQDKARCAFRVYEASGSGVLLCVMGKPKANYRLTGAVSGVQTSDENGVVVVHLPKDTALQTLEVSPTTEER